MYLRCYIFSHFDIERDSGNDSLEVCDSMKLIVPIVRIYISVSNLDVRAHCLSLFMRGSYGTGIGRPPWSKFG